MDIERPEIGGCCPECKREVEQGRAEFDILAESLRDGDIAAKLQGLREKIGKQRAVAPVSQRQMFDRKFHTKGKKGDVVEVSVDIERLCRVEKFVATDTANNEGTQIKLSPMKQYQARLTKEWAPNSLGCGISFGMFKPGDKFTVEVEFLVDCEWSGVIFGVMAIQK